MNVALALTALAATASPDIQSVLDRVRVAQEVPGVSAVVTHHDRVVFAGGSGVADIETARAMTAETVVYAGSLTKILTAVLTLRLVEEDRLSLDQRVDGIARHSSDVKVVHLLTHASGLEREGNFEYWFSADFPDRMRLARYLKAATLRTPPGAALHYSNVGYAALGLVIERASGQTYAEALRARVLAPLGMTSSGARGPKASVATGYTPINRVIPNETRPFAGVGRRVGTRHVREYHDARAMSPAFGAYTSATDLGRLARFLLGHGGDEVLSPEMRARMRTRQDSGWGLGLKVGDYAGRPIARHEGWFAAHRSHLLLDTSDGIGVAVLTNSDSARPAKIAEALFTAVLDAPIALGSSPD